MIRAEWRGQTYGAASGPGILSEAAQRRRLNAFRPVADTEIGRRES